MFFGTLKANAHRKPLMIFFRSPFLRSLPLLAALCACTPTYRNVSNAIGRGQPQEAVKLLGTLLNQEGNITTAKRDELLIAMTLNRRFTLAHADDLFDRLKPDGRSAILGWYIQVYLERAEKALSKNKFADARTIWVHHQKIRNGAFPNFQESTPVLGIIDLRESEYWLSKKNWGKARQLYEAARKKLSKRESFDQVQQFEFADMAQSIQKKLNQANRPSGPKRNPPAKRQRRGH